MKKSHILITGAKGEIGTELIKSISKNNSCNILTLDLYELEPDVSKCVDKHIVGNLTDSEIIEKINLDYRIDSIYHLAAILSTNSELSPIVAHKVNVNGTVNIFELGRKQSEKYKCNVKVFFPSSIAVYGLTNELKESVISENQALNPITMYGCNKIYAEKLGVYYSSHYSKQVNNEISNIDFRCIRFPGLISSTTMPSGGTSDFIPEMWHNIANSNNYNCFVNSNTRLPFLAMQDAIDSINQLMKVDISYVKSKIYNISGFSPSVSEFFKKVKLYYPAADISYTINSMRQNIVDSWPNYLDDSLARKEWNWTPKFNLDNLFNDYLINSNDKKLEK